MFPPCYRFATSLQIIPNDLKKMILWKVFLHTFIIGRASDAAPNSGLGIRLLKVSSLVSAPVFFILGEPVERELLILSAYVLRGKLGDSLNESMLPGAEMPFGNNGLEGKFLSVSEAEEKSLIRGNSELTFTARFD